MPVATPYRAINPSVLIGTGTPDELICHARRVALVPEDEMADVETFCNPGGEAPSTTTWTLTIEALQSFGPEGANPGLWDTLRPLAKTQQTVVVKPLDGAAGPTNPSATMTVWVPSIPFIDSAIGEATTFDIEFRVVGEPVFAIV
jgi:hypothetical protein